MLACMAHAFCGKSQDPEGDEGRVVLAVTVVEMAHLSGIRAVQ